MKARLFIAAVAVCFCVSFAAYAQSGLRIYWVDVEGGAATLIVTPAGESILLDTGLDGDRDPGRIAALAKNIAKVERIDHLIITHFDVDHHGGAANLSKLIPIGRVYDPGGQRVKPHPTYEKYINFRKTKPYTPLVPGDVVPLKQAGGAEVKLQCLGAKKRFLDPQADHALNPIPATDSPDYSVDTSENANSTAMLLTVGAFKFLDAADLTARLELLLVHPYNLVGEVDVYQVDHHGLDSSNNPVLIRSIQPKVTVMNNGHRKGCMPNTRKTLRSVKSIQANYQVHKNLKPDADNTADELIANFVSSKECKAHHIELHVAPDGTSYTVRIPATKHERTFQSQ